MARFLTRDLISSEFESIITGAKTQVTLITPCLKLTTTFFEQLMGIQSRGVRTTLVYDKTDFTHGRKQWLSEFTHLDLFHFENLHARCYYNDNRMVITSTDIDEYATSVGDEMGILLTEDQDRGPFGDAISVAESIVARAVRVDPAEVLTEREPSFFLAEVLTDLARIKEDIKGIAVFLKKDLERTKEDMRKDLERTKEDIRKDAERTREDIKKAALFLKNDAYNTGRDLKKLAPVRKGGDSPQKDSSGIGVGKPAPKTGITTKSRPLPTRRIGYHHGFCIRCGDSIDYFPNAPFCDGCHRIWLSNKTPTVTEYYCHRCGISNAGTSKSDPLCYSCRRRIQKQKRVFA